MQGDVALRKESVDRNNTPTAWYRASDTSLSARRAWIEIYNATSNPANKLKVALRKESVDRNLLMWYQCNTVVVALRKESVDRNLK